MAGIELVGLRLPAFVVPPQGYEVTDRVEGRGLAASTAITTATRRNPADSPIVSASAPITGGPTRKAR